MDASITSLDASSRRTEDGAWGRQGAYHRPHRQYHLIWCPKDHESVLQVEEREYREQRNEETRDELEIIALAIRPDIVRVFSTGDPTLAPNNIMEQGNGYSSRRRWGGFEFGLPSLWTRSDSVSSGDDLFIEEYIDAQAGE